MPMTEKLRKLLSTVCKDQKHDDKPLFDVVEGWFKATERPDLSDDLEQAKKDLKEVVDERTGLKSKLKEKDSEIETLKTSQLSDEQKQKLVDSESMQSQLNTVTASVAKLTADLNSSQERGLAKDKAILEGERKTANASLENDLSTALVAAGIKNPKSIQLAKALNKAEGLATVTETEGVFGRRFQYMKDGNPYSLEGLDGVAKHLSENYKSLVDPSGGGGMGGESFQSGNSGTPVDNKASLQEARSNAAKNF